MHLAGMILPIFAIILAGWIAGASGYVPRALAGALMQFAYYVAMPALVFLVIAQERLGALLEWSFLAAFGGGSLICFALVMLVARVAFGKPLANSAMIGAAASMTNTGFVALPILKILYGQHGVLAAAVATVFVGAILFPVLVVLLELGRADVAQDQPQSAPRKSLARQIGTNPVILATLAGLAWSVGGLSLPAPAVSFLTILGEALTPCALFAIGLDLTIDAMRGKLGVCALLSAFKLVLMPLVVFGICMMVGLNRISTIAAVVCAGVPTAKSAYVLAHEYDIEKTLLGAAISMTTLFSIVSLLAWLYVL